MIGQHLCISHAIEEDSAVHLDVEVGQVERTIISNRHLDKVADRKYFADAAEGGSGDAGALEDAIRHVVQNEDLSQTTYCVEW